MNTPLYLAARRQPNLMFGTETFDAKHQLRLLEFATGQGQWVLLPCLETGAPLPPSANILCIGDAAQPLLLALRRQASAALRRPGYGEAPLWPRLGNLILLAADLPAGVFSADAPAFSEAAFALRCFERIVVLHCALDVTGGELGRTGAAAGAGPRVSSVDIAPYIEFRDDSAYGALCACETLQLIIRLLRGVAPQAALPQRRP